MIKGIYYEQKAMEKGTMGTRQTSRDTHALHYWVKENAKEHFGNMAQNEELYTEEHKHIFNEPGITLRRNGMFEEAVRNYTKALEIDANDEPLYFNMARAYKEWGNNPEALSNIRKAIELNPKFTEAQSLLKTLQ